MEPEHTIIKNNSENIILFQNFKKQNSNGEYIFQIMFFANAYHQIGVNYYPKYLSAIPFTLQWHKIFFL